MSDNNKMTKREFLSRIAVVTGSAFVATKLFSNPAFAQEKRRGAKPDAAPLKDTDLPWVESGKGLADSMAYHSTHADADKDKKTDKKTDKGVAFEKRFCSNCNFYKKVGLKDGKEAGKCTLFDKMLVQSEGICNSWAKKA